MEVSTALLLRTPLFRGNPQEALPALLEGLGARKRRCGRGEVVLRRGERADRLGLVLSGTLHIVKEDFWGSRTIVGLARSGEVFAEAYACLGGEPLEVAVLAAADAEVLFLSSVRAFFILALVTSSPKVLPDFSFMYLEIYGSVRLNCAAMSASDTVL